MRRYLAIATILLPAASLSTVLIGLSHASRMRTLSWSKRTASSSTRTSRSPRCRRNSRTRAASLMRPTGIWRLRISSLTKRTAGSWRSTRCSRASRSSGDEPATVGRERRMSEKRPVEDDNGDREAANETSDIHKRGHDRSGRGRPVEATLESKRQHGACERPHRTMSTSERATVTATRT